MIKDFCHNGDKILISWWKSVRILQLSSKLGQDLAHAGSCSQDLFLLPESLLTVSGALKDFLARRSMWEYCRFYEKHLKMFWIFLIFERRFHWISGMQGFMWWRLLESKWFGQDSEITQEWLDGRRTGCLSKAFFLTLPTISRWGSMKTQQHWKNRIEPKAQSILMRQKHPAKSLVYWCWTCSKPKEKDSESIKIVGLWDLQCKHD